MIKKATSLHGGTLINRVLYGVERNPIRFEHFGITTVEAMAAECVPVVINKAGQVEVVRHGKDGFLWSGLGELLKIYYAVD